MGRCTATSTAGLASLIERDYLDAGLPQEGNGALSLTVCSQWAMWQQVWMVWGRHASRGGLRLPAEWYPMHKGDT